MSSPPFPKAAPARSTSERPAEKIPIGSWEELRVGSDVALLAVGSMVEVALDAADRLAADGVEVGVVNCRFVKPLDESLLADLSRRYGELVTMEENVLTGGFGSAVTEWFIHRGAGLPRLHNRGIPDRFITHGSRSDLLKEVDLDVDATHRFVLELAGKLDRTH